MNSQLHERIVSHPFFEGMRPEHLEILATGASETVFKPNEIIFLENDPAARFYLIESGNVVLEAHEPNDGVISIETLTEGEVLGWSWLFPPFVWHFQAKAMEPTTAVVLDGAHLLVTSEANHAFGFELMRRVSQVVIRRLQSTRKQLLRQSIESAYDG
jgi:CRP/FNR family cyclic AMP-dependent transcriptional regulator